MDLDEGERPASKRIQEVLDRNVTTLCVSCTFCLHMFEDAVRLLDGKEPFEIVDWLELLLWATRPGPR